MPVLTFESESHVYAIDDVIVPSVTQVLQSVGLIDYSFMTAAQREFALARGRAVHFACQLDDENDLDEAALDESLKPYLGAWRRFKDEMKFRCELIEHRVFHPLFRFGGTLDRIGLLDGSAAIVDIKTNEAAYWTAFQLAGYAACFDKPMRFRRFGVALHDDETYSASEYRIENFRRHWNVFLAALTIHNEKERKRA